MQDTTPCPLPFIVLVHLILVMDGPEGYGVEDLCDAYAGLGGGEEVGEWEWGR